jgi:epsilon-lactone hydrolase
MHRRRAGLSAHARTSGQGRFRRGVSALSGTSRHGGLFKPNRLMGDSAGGGMGLALAMQARAKGVEQPSDIVLLSPWLDVTMTNPDIKAVDKFDPFLDIQGAKYLGKIYAGETDPANYLVSPIYGSVKNLAPITLFIGTHDILVPDCRKFKVEAKAEGVEIDYHEYESMIHVWMLISSPEAKKAAKAIVDKFGK